MQITLLAKLLSTAEVNSMQQVTMGQGWLLFVELLAQFQGVLVPAFCRGPFNSTPEQSRRWRQMGALLRSLGHGGVFLSENEER